MSKEELEARIERKKKQLADFQKFKWAIPNKEECQKREDALLDDLSKLLKKRK